MLKLDHNYNFTLKERKGISPTLIRAVLITVCIYLFSVIIFHVSPIKINVSNTIYPPVAVKIDLGSTKLQVEKKKVSIHPLTPPYPTPKYPPLP